MQAKTLIWLLLALSAVSLHFRYRPTTQLVTEGDRCWSGGQTWGSKSPESDTAVRPEADLLDYWKLRSVSRDWV